MINIVKIKTKKVINIVKLSQNSFFSLIIAKMFYNFTVLHKPY